MPTAAPTARSTRSASGSACGRLPGLHCYDIYAGAERIKAFLEEQPGTYLLTDYLVRSFERSVVVELGLDRYPELRDDYFHSYTRAVWLAQDPDGEQVSLQIRNTFGVFQDKEVTKYVTLVGTVLAQASSRPGLNWEFIVLDTDGVNAFAAPGGIVHITRGALGLAKTEAELAGVLGHEITARHREAHHRLDREEQHGRHGHRSDSARAA